MYAGLQTNLFHQEHCGPLLNILGAQTEILGAHTVNQHANQIFTFEHIFTVLLMHIVILDAEMTMCCFKFRVTFYCDSHLSVLLAQKHPFHRSAPVSRECGLTERCASSLPVASPLRCDKRFLGENPFTGLTRTMWMKQVNNKVADTAGTLAARSQGVQCWMLFRSQLKPSTVDDGLCLHSNLKHHSIQLIQFIAGLVGCRM